jgi:predicted ferric reductase
VRHRSRWLIRYQVAYGAAAFVNVLMLGLIGAPAGVAVGTGFWMLAMIILSVYALRQPVAYRGMGWSHSIMIAAWALVYMAVLIPGSARFEGEPAWWLPGSVAVALPPLLSAYMTARRLRTGRA